MRAAEGVLIADRLFHGDTTGAHHVQDFFTQMSHAGANTHLMQAHSLMQAGASAIAAQHLAAAHAFFSGDEVGQFDVDKRGNIWGQHYDARDPSRPVGPPFLVTQEAVEMLLIQTTNPQEYLNEALAVHRAGGRGQTASFEGPLVFTVRSPPPPPEIAC